MKAVHIDNHTIGQAQEIKLLGVILDVNLQFSEHIKQKQKYWHVI